MTSEKEHKDHSSNSSASEPGNHGAPMSLYEQIGGEIGVQVFVNEMYGALISDPYLSHFFQEKDLEVLKRDQQDFVALVLGGRPPFDYWDIITSEAPPDLTLEQTDRMINHAENVLHGMNLHHQLAKSVVRVVSPFIEAFLSGSSRIHPDSLQKYRAYFQPLTKTQETPAISDVEIETIAPITNSQPTEPVKNQEDPGRVFRESDLEVENAKKFRELIEEQLALKREYQSGERVLEWNGAIPQDNLEKLNENNVSEPSTKFPPVVQNPLQSDFFQSDFYSALCKELELIKAENVQALTDESRHFSNAFTAFSSIVEQMATASGEQLATRQEFHALASEIYKISLALDPSNLTQTEEAEDLEKLQTSCFDGLKSLKVLYEKHLELEQSVRVLRGISTRLVTLALNAALEAARAGGQGKCFSVIAKEIKNIALEGEGLSKWMSVRLRRAQNHTQKSGNTFLGVGRQIEKLKEEASAVSEEKNATNGLSLELLKKSERLFSALNSAPLVQPDRFAQRLSSLRLDCQQAFAKLQEEITKLESRIACAGANNDRE